MKTSLRSFLLRLLPFLFIILCFPVLSSAKEVVIGVIMTGDIPYYRSMHEAFAKELKSRLPAGEDVQYILQRPFPDPIAWSNAARKLIALEVDLIVSYGASATHAVLFEKCGIPVVYAGVYEPDKAGFAGPNVTGCGFRVPLSSLLRYFKRIRYIEKLQVVYSSSEEDSVRQLDELIGLARQQRIDLLRNDIRSQDDLKKLERVGNGDAVFVTGSAAAHVWVNDILSIIGTKQVPAVDIFPDPAENGMLFTLFQPAEQLGERAAELAFKIIGGEPVHNIPPVVLRKTELVLNLVQAKKLGITFPIQLIVEATRVIK